MCVCVCVQSDREIERVGVERKRDKESVCVER